jgi:hypothetical protein
MTTKSYLLTRNFDTLPDTFIRVGHILSDATDPLSTLNADDYSPPPASITQKTSKCGFNATRSQIRSGKVGIWAQILEHATAGAEANFSRNKEDVYTIATVETEQIWLAKKDAKDYVKKSVDGEVKEYLEGGKYKKPVFLITGVKVAKGAKSINSQDTRDKGGDLKVMVNVTPSFPLKLGPEVEGKSSRVSETNFTGGEDFVFAYQLRKLVCSKNKPLKDGEYLKGALFDADTKKSQGEEIEVVVAEEDLNGGELGDAEAIRIQDEGEGDSDICIVVKGDD